MSITYENNTYYIVFNSDLFHKILHQINDIDPYANIYYEIYTFLSQYFNEQFSFHKTKCYDFYIVSPFLCTA